MRQSAMSRAPTGRDGAAGKPQGLRQVGSALAGVLDPVAARRGFGTARLMASWDEIVGQGMGAWTRPEKLAFTRGAASGGVLTVAVSGPRAVLLQHEIPQLIQRLNAFLGFAAVAEIRIVQRPFEAPQRRTRPAAPIADADRAALDAAVAPVAAEGLRDSLRRLGEAVLADRIAKE